MKKIISLILTVLMLSALITTFTSCSDKKEVIGIMQFGSHESLNNCYTGIIDGLKEAGINVEDYEIQLLNDNFNTDVATSHAKTLVNKGASIIISIATPSAMAAANAADGEIPVVYCAVTDDGIMKNYTNVCGASDRPNYVKTLETVTAFMGKTDLKIGVISHTSESSDEIMISDLKSAAQTYSGMEISVKYITDISTISATVDSLISDGVDCFLNLLDNTVVGQLENILEKTNEAKIPVFGSEVEQVVKGCLATSSIDYIEVGKIAGNMAGKILLGEKNANELGNQVISEPKLYYNPQVAENLGMTVPEIEGLKSIANYNK